MVGSLSVKSGLDIEFNVARLPTLRELTMLTELTFLSAFLAGLLGATHCIGMCGSIVGALSMSLPANVQQSAFRLGFYLLAYNLGRIISYTVAGILIGFLGAQVLQMLSLNNPHLVMKWISGLFMIVLGLYLGEWWQALAFLEKLGAHLWRRIEPLGHSLLPVKRPLQALGFGLVWGWLPCGLVYSILAFSLVSCDAWQGGLMMLAFGLGTLPLSMVLGVMAPALKRFVHQRIVRKLVGAIIIGLGLLIIGFK